MRNLFYYLAALVLGTLLSACTPFVKPTVLAEKRRAIEAPIASKILIAIDPRFHYQEYKNHDALNQYYQHIEERLQAGIVKRGRSVAIAPRTRGAFVPAMDVETVRSSNASHILFLTHESARSDNNGIITLRWRMSYLQNKAQAGGEERDYKPEFQSLFEYFPCMGKLPLKAAWEGCADVVADHMIERLISNGLI